VDQAESAEGLDLKGVGSSARQLTRIGTQCKHAKMSDASISKSLTETKEKQDGISKR
jgi:hypothetical protein